MITLEKGGEQSPSFAPIEIAVIPEVPASELERNIRLNAANSVPFLLGRPHLKKSEPLAIVGGGPSLKQTVGELRKFKNIMVCGTAHDYVVNQGIHPTYAVICDQAPWTHYLRRPWGKCTYLLATQCHPDIFEHLDGFPCLKWDMDGWADEAVFEGRKRVNGGTTAAMRAPALGLILGFDDFHFFGVDSSFEDDRDRHAYAYEDESLTSPATMARINGRMFRTTLTWIQQARDFQILVSTFGHMFSVTVHGESLMQATWQDMRDKHDKLFRTGRNQ